MSQGGQFLMSLDNHEGVERPVWRGERMLNPGEVLYRGCPTATEAVALDMLSAARFFATRRELALGYARWRPQGDISLPGYLLEARVTRPLLLAVARSAPIVEAAFARSREAHPQEMQRRYMIRICNAYAGRQYDGIYDNDGDDVLIGCPLDGLEIVSVERLGSIPGST